MSRLRIQSPPASQHRGQRATIKVEPLESRALLDAIALRDQYLPEPAMVEPAARPLWSPRALPSHAVRIAYLIPSNRSPQPDAVSRLRNSVRWFHDWFAQQMDRNGFGPKTFQFETEADGITPRIHIANLPNLDSYYRDDANNGANTWGRVLSDAGAVGIQVWSAGQVWMLVYEGHVQRPDATIAGGFFGGAGFGSGSDGGVALLGSDSLALIRPEAITDDRPYHGMIIPQLGPYPLVQDVSFPWFLGNTISSLVSSFQGDYLHELTHAFGIGHDFRNDANFHGNLMGNGHRGLRATLYPSRYPNEDARLSFGVAMALSTSRYFNVGQAIGDDVRPTISSVSGGSVPPVNGLLPLSFSAQDSSGLASALLYRGGDLVGQLPLSGTSFSATFNTPWYEPGIANSFTVTVYDRFGNRSNFDTTITPAAGFNRAPQSFIKSDIYTPFVDQPVLLEAWWSTDPDHPTSTLQVQWDLDGDGVFDTTADPDLGLSIDFDTPGVRMIRARLIDPPGAQSVSEPIALRVLSADTIPPQVLASEFPFELGPHRVNFTFSEEVAGSIGLEDLTVQNLTSGAMVPASAMLLSYGPGQLATLRFPGLDRGILPDGNYRVRIAAAGVNDRAGNPMVADHIFDFFHLCGDANRDRAVNQLDLDVLALNWQQSPRTFTQGDFNYDTRVDARDLLILAGRWLGSLASLLPERPDSSGPAGLQEIDYFLPRPVEQVDLPTIADVL